MVLVIEKKFLEGTWWKYGLALVIAKLSLWIALAYHWNPELDLGTLVQRGGFVIACFTVTAFLPFAAGRLQLRRLFWFSLTGFLLGETAYLFLVLAHFGQRFELLPLIAYLQLYTTCFGLGLIVELGRYVYLKLTE